MDVFITIWKYEIRKDKISEFEELYGQTGKWVKLFQKDPSYLKTNLFHECSSPYSYITIDYWKSKDAYYNFKAENKNDFSDIDKSGEELTVSEVHLGEFYSTSVLSF